MINRMMIGSGLLAVAVAVAGCKKEDKKPGTATAETDKVGAKGTATGVGTGTGTGAGAGTAKTPLETANITYNAGSTILKGYIAAPTGPGKHPGVLVVHEWWGQNDYARMRARKLAELGYVALAVDMYGDGQTADTPDAAGKLAGSVMSDPAVAIERLNAARETLAKDPRVDPDQIAAIGYCFGGGVVLAAARAGVELDAVASFHGTLTSPAPMEKGKFDGKILIAHGGSDPMVPPADVEAVKKELTEAGVEHEVVVYEGATHAFTNPDATATGEKFKLPVKYDAAADEASWKELTELLATTWAS